MARYFEEDEEPEIEEPRRDTEVTLSWGALLGMGFALLVICGLCFGLGYMVGHRGPAPAAAHASSSQPSAPDEEPLQGSGSVPKPSALAQAPVPPPAQANDTAPTPAEGESPEAVAPSPAQGTQVGAPGTSMPAQSGAAPTQPQVRSAVPGSTPGNAPSAAGSSVRPALPSATSLMVQVAAVKNEEDANVLTNALRRRGYPVTARRDPVDGLIHVRIGPFPTRDEANQWRMKLLGDGYNAIVQP
jgi:DedD protein